MKALNVIGTQTFSWRPMKGVKKTIEVYAGSDIYGTLRQERGRPTVLVTVDGRWTIEKRKGTTTVHADTGATIATFVADTESTKNSVVAGYSNAWPDSHLCSIGSRLPRANLRTTPSERLCSEQLAGSWWRSTTGFLVLSVKVRLTRTLILPEDSSLPLGCQLPELALDDSLLPVVEQDARRV